MRESRSHTTWQVWSWASARGVGPRRQARRRRVRQAVVRWVLKTRWETATVLNPRTVFGQLLQKVSPFARKVGLKLGFEFQWVLTSLNVPEESFQPVLTLFPFALFTASCHLPLWAGLSRRPNFNGRILKRSRLQSHFTATLQMEKSRNQASPYLKVHGLPLTPDLFENLTFSRSSTTSVCTRPWIHSPFTWVMRSPALSPASWAGLLSSTL